MKYSIVTLNNVLVDNEIFRYDADYFHPDALNILSLLKSKKYCPIEKDFDVTKLAGFEYTEYFTEENMASVNYYIALTSKNIQNEELNLQEYLKIDKIVADENLKRSKLLKGDVILSYTGEYRRALTLFEDNYQLGPNICLIRNKNSELKPTYLSTFLNSKFGQTMLDKEKTLSAQPTVAMSRIRKIPIPILSDGFQKLIDWCIKLKHSNIEKSKKLYKQSEELLLNELDLLDWQPKHNLYSIKKYSEIKKANRYDAEYFQPKYGEILKIIKESSNGYDILGNIVSIKKGIEVGSDEYQGNGIPFVRVSNLNKFGINENNQQYISQKTYDRLALEYQPQKGEILLSKDGTAGITYYIDETPQRMILSGGILRLTITDSEYLPEYLTLVLNSILVQQQIERTYSGALIHHWLINEINSTLIPKLDIQKQREIVEKIQVSFKCRKQSKQLLEIAKRGVEIAIEQDEDIATRWINQELQKIGVEL